MTILDSNVLSALTHPTPDERVVAWLNKQPRTSMRITSVTILEIHLGLQLLPVGRRRSHLTKEFEAGLADDIDWREAPFDTVAAQYSASLKASRHKKELPVELRDTMIAGIVLACNATLATRLSLGKFPFLSLIRGRMGPETIP